MMSFPFICSNIPAAHAYGKLVRMDMDVNENERLSNYTL